VRSLLPSQCIWAPPADWLSAFRDANHVRHRARSCLPDARIDDEVLASGDDGLAYVDDVELTCFRGRRRLGSEATILSLDRMPRSNPARLGVPQLSKRAYTLVSRINKLRQFLAYHGPAVDRCLRTTGLGWLKMRQERGLIESPD